MNRLKIIFCNAVIFLVPLFADLAQGQQIVPVWGRGSYSSFCQPYVGQFCIDDAQREAKRRAERETENQCLLSQGRLEVWSLYCRSNCNPSFFPPGETQGVWVNCWSDCNGNCQK